MIHQIKTQSQHIGVLPQQIQLLKLFHLTNSELHQRVQDELNENPLLEENVDSELQNDSSKETIQDYQDEDEYQYDDIPDYRIEHNNYLSENNLPQLPISESINFRKELKEQIRFSLQDEKDFELADYLIDSLDESGLLEQSLEEITDDYSFKKLRAINTEEVEKIRSQLKKLGSGGAGCFSIQEYLLLQLHERPLKNPIIKKAICLLEQYSLSFMYKNVDTVTELLGIDKFELQIIFELIRSCKLKPFTEINQFDLNRSVIPDFIVRRSEDGFEITLHNQRSSTLFINHSIMQSLSKQNPADKRALIYLKGKVSSAKWFVDAIRQREVTMQKIMRAIIEFQYDYFLDGDITQLKPMILRNITDRCGVDIASVSRITCNKYADTDFGVICLKDLFSEGIENLQGKNVSNKVIQAAIENIIQNEDRKNQLTDQQLVALLSAKGFNIARRTVAKYREQLNIPSAQLRSILVS